MDANELLRQMTIPTQCHQDWNTMDGGDRARFCESCGKHVHNLTAMRSEEVVSLIQHAGGNVCGRVFEQSDGTLFISDTPSARHAHGHPVQFHLRSVMGVIAAVAAVLGLARLFPERTEPPAIPTIPPKLNTMVLGKMAYRPPVQSSPPNLNTMVMGELILQPPLQPSPPASGSCAAQK